MSIHVGLGHVQKCFSQGDGEKQTEKEQKESMPIEYIELWEF